MKIVTVNVPESYIDAINKLIREFLIKELKLANNMAKYNEVEIEDFDDENFVRVPIERLNENSEPVRDFKTYKILKRLEY